MDVDGGLTALDELKLYQEAHRTGPHRVRITPQAMTNVLIAAFRALADKDAEIARLQAELDAASDVPVEYVTEAGLAAAMAADPHREDGSLLRVTDGKQQAWA